MNKIKWLVPVTLLLFVGCAEGPNAATHEALTCVAENLSGFWWGLLNGMTVPFSIWGRLLTDGSIAIYDVCNNGGWYDFGFALGVGGTLLVDFK